MTGLSVQMRYDLRGRPVAIGTAAAPSRFAAYAYAPDGALVGETQAGGSRTRRFGYDRLRRLVSLDDPAFALTLSYRVGGGTGGPDGDGRITGESLAYKAAAFAGPVPAATASLYRYDPFGRLLAVEASRKAAAAELSYDADGNIAAKASGSAGAARYAYAPGMNRLAQVRDASGNTFDLAHDADGAVSGLGPLRLRHDGPGGRLSRVAGAAATLRYHHNAGGERVLKRVAGAGALTRLTLRAGAATLAERDGAGRSEAYVAGPGGLTALVVDGVDHAVAGDHRGSVKVVSAGGPALAQFDYLAFGGLDETNSQSATPLAARIRRRYTGQEFEAETGLYSYHARAYDPALGRFLSPDPARQGASPYAYVGNDPVNFSDPSGDMRLINRIAETVVGGRYMKFFVDNQGYVAAIVDSPLAKQEEAAAFVKTIYKFNKQYDGTNLVLDLDPKAKVETFSFRESKSAWKAITKSLQQSKRANFGYSFPSLFSFKFEDLVEQRIGEEIVEDTVREIPKGRKRPAITTSDAITTSEKVSTTSPKKPVSAKSRFLTKRDPIEFSDEVETWKTTVYRSISHPTRGRFFAILETKVGFRNFDSYTLSNRGRVKILSSDGTREAILDETPW